VGEEKKLDKVKQHFKRNSKLYLGIGIGVGVTLIGGAIFAKTPSGQAAIKNVVAMNWKPTVNNTLVYTEGLERRGHPGYIVKCIETGEVFASQQRASDLLNLNPSDLSKHLNGESNHVKGLTFERLGEATA